MFGKPQNTGLRPRNFQGGLSAPGRQMISPKQGQGGSGVMGLINRMPTENWFHLAGALGRPGQSFLEGVGNTAQTMTELRQGQDEEEWARRLREMQVRQFDRSEQQFSQQTEDREREQQRIAGLRQSIATHYQESGNEQLAELAMSAPEETLGQLLTELSPEGRRRVALHNAQMESLQAQAAYRRAQASNPYQGGVDYSNQGLARVDSRNGQRYTIHTADSPGIPPIVRDSSGREISSEQFAEVQPHLTEDRPVVEDSVVARGLVQRMTNYGFVDRTANSMIDLARAAPDPNALNNVTGAVSRVAGSVESQLGAAMSLLDGGGGSERALASQVGDLQSQVAAQMPEGLRSNSQAASVFQSLIIEMAFAQARTLNGSGRLSNDDFRQAKDTIIGSDWDATLSNISRIRDNTRAGIADELRAQAAVSGNQLSDDRINTIINQGVGSSVQPRPAGRERNFDDFLAGR